MKHIKLFERFEETNEAQKFTRTTTGKHLPVGKKAQSEIKVTKQQWTSMFDKLQAMPDDKKNEVLMKLHQIGLL